jgi:hypothetical protein
MSNRQFVRDLNAWCREHSALIAELRVRFTEIQIRVVMHDGVDVSVRARWPDEAFEELRRLNEAHGGPRTETEKHAAVMAGLVGME